MCLAKELANLKRETNQKRNANQATSAQNKGRSFAKKWQKIGTKKGADLANRLEKIGKPSTLCLFFESPPTGAMMALETIESEVAGNLWKIEVQVGEQVTEEDVLMILESMKMEIPVLAPVAGTVKEILVAVDDKIAEGQAVVLLEIPS